MAGNGLCTIGGRTHSHAILSHLNDDELERELDLSLTMLRDEAGIVTVHYSYPEGQEHCFNGKVIAKLRERGIMCCPTAIDGTNDRSETPFLLKRCEVK